MASEKQVVAEMQQDGNAPITDNQDFEAGEQQEVQASETSEQSVEQQTPQAEEVNWEESAKYFQSEKDKMQTENAKIKEDLEKYKALGQFVESREDVQQYIQDAVSGKVEEQPQIQVPEDFDPWEAYNDPNSASFQYRTAMEQKNIELAVKSSNAQLHEQIESKDRAAKIDNELVKEGLSDADKDNFYKFANTPINQLGTDVLVRMWRAADQNLNPGVNQPSQEMEVVRKNMQEPTPTGVLQGEQPPAVNESDKMWDGIMKASQRTKVL